MVSLTNCFTSMFAGIVVFSVIGFKATMTYEKCLDDRNRTLTDLLGYYDPTLTLPENGTIFNFTDASGTFRSVIVPALQVCDLEKELGNVSFFFTFFFE